MFDKNKFSIIMRKIKDSYENQEEFAKLSGINRTYISKYINLKQEKPPKPTTLLKLANASKGITSYLELMNVCGYITEYDRQLEELEKAREQITKEIITDINLDYGFFDEDEKEIYSYFFSKFKDMAHDTTNITAYDNIKLEIEKSNYSSDTKEKIINMLRDYTALLATNKAANDTYEEELKSKIKIEGNVFPIPDKPVPIPIIGNIAAGLPILAIQNIIGYAYLPEGEFNKRPNSFYLTVKGDSMNKKFQNGDLVLIDPDIEVKDGDIAAVLIDDEATVKEFHSSDGVIILQPLSTNKEHKMQIYNPKKTNIKIIGKIVSFQGRV